MSDSLTTEQNGWQLASLAAHITTGVGVTTDRPYIAATEAAGPTAAAAGVLIPVSGNNLLVDVLNQTSGYATDVRIVGWRFNGGIGSGVWKPELLGQATATAHTVGISLLSTTMYPAISYVVNQGSANCKVVNGTGYACPTSLQIDHRGCRFVELVFTTAAAKSVNAAISYL